MDERGLSEKQLLLNVGCLTVDWGGINFFGCDSLEKSVGLMNDRCVLINLVLINYALIN